MKKFFKFLGILVLLIVIVLIVAGMTAPKETFVERSTLIKGDKAVVRDQMFNYANYKNWNPWDDDDPEMKSNVSEDGQKYDWEGSSTGKGEMITKAEDANTKTIDLHFIKPFESNAVVVYKLEEIGNGEIKATQNIRVPKPGFPWSGIGVLMGSKKMMETAFEKGLKDLKEYVESGKAGPAPAADINIQEVQYPGGTYATIRKTIGWADMDKFFGDSYSALSQSAGQRINGIPVGMYYVWDEKNMQADVAAGFPVSGTEPVKGATMVTLPASGAYMVTYVGGYSGSAKVHEALGKHLGEKGKEMTVVLEEYVKSPGEEKDSNKYVTNIYYLLK